MQETYVLVQKRLLKTVQKELNKNNEISFTQVNLNKNQRIRNWNL
jgi:hypothetical protein